MFQVRIERHLKDFVSELDASNWLQFELSILRSLKNYCLGHLVLL